MENKPHISLQQGILQTIIENLNHKHSNCRKRIGKDGQLCNVTVLIVIYRHDTQENMKIVYFCIPLGFSLFNFFHLLQTLADQYSVGER